MRWKKWSVTAELDTNKELRLIERFIEFGKCYYPFDEDNQVVYAQTQVKISIIKACSLYLKLSKMGIYSMFYKG